MTTALQVRDIRLLQVFRAVVDAGGISAAQDILGMTQSNISVQVADLEVRLGFTLCERGRAGFRLTAEGSEVYRATGNLLADLGEYNDQFRSIGKGLRGELNVGHLDNYLSHPDNPIVAVMTELGSRSSDIRFKLRQGTLAELEQLLQQSEIQIAIGNFTRFIDGVTYLELHDEEQVLCCGAPHPMFSLTPNEVTWQQVQNAGSVAFGNKMMDAATGLGPQVATANTLDGVLMLVLAGQGIAYLPGHMADPYIIQGKLRRLETGRPQQNLTFYLAYRDKSERSPLVREFRDLLL